MKKLVVIGGGFAGSYIAKKLESEFDVTLVDTKDYFEYTPGILRVLVEPEHYRQLQVKHKDYLGKAKIVVGCVSELGNETGNGGGGYVKLRGKRGKIGFDYLTVCSGSRYNYPIKEQNVFFATRIKHLGESYDKLMDANRICVVGGGLVGVELTSELCTHFSRDVKISLIHSHKHLMERNNAKSQEYAENFFKNNEVELVFNERVKKVKGKNLITDKGREFGCDMSFFTVGIKPNVDFMKKNFFGSLENGIRVNKFLQLINSRGKGRVGGVIKNIFVSGDVTSIKEEKTARNAEKQAKVIVHNLRAVLRGGKMVEYKSNNDWRPMVISLGKYDGIFEWGNFILTGRIPAFMKWAIEKWIMRMYS